MKVFQILFFTAIALGGFQHSFSQVSYPGTPPGNARAWRLGDTVLLQNNSLEMEWLTRGGKMKLFSFTDKSNKNKIDLSASNWFDLVLKDSSHITDRDFRLGGKLQIRDIHPDPHAARYAGRLGDKIIFARFVDAQEGLDIDWEAKLTNGANYIRQTWVFHAKDKLPIFRYALVEIPSANARQEGTVDGSPLVSGQMFFALEHPMSHDEITATNARCYLLRQDPLLPGESLVLTTVAGVTPKDQLRRGFVYYLERERAHPYRPFLHYNSWYDLSWVDRKMEEKSCMDRIRMYGDSLIRKRHVPLKAFLFDDGWDNDSTLWEISKNFPHGFTNMLYLAKTYNAKLGVWISPWGGYDPSQSKRLKYGRMQHPPFETNANGFSLAGPVYYQRFKEVTNRFIRKDGVVIFKFDGVGAGNGASGAGLAYQKDIEALLRLTKALRETDPDIYLSLTVGTWPSPYWLYYGDATWRAGGDFGLTGAGDKRQQWITYRDAQVYKNVVQRAPLYPLSSLMVHGICIANNGYPKALEMDLKDISDGIWSFFGSGTSLQELYINPHLLTTAMWDCLAAAAKWSAGNTGIMPDVHWVGGDPGKGAVYGHAAWSPHGGMISIRNPSSVPQNFTLDLRQIFELPAGAPSGYVLQDVKTPGNKRIIAAAGMPVTILLQPFEVKVWDAVPINE